MKVVTSGAVVARLPGRPVFPEPLAGSVHL